jgi:hypothetical protein
MDISILRISHDEGARRPFQFLRQLQSGEVVVVFLFHVTIIAHIDSGISVCSGNPGTSGIGRTMVFGENGFHGSFLCCVAFGGKANLVDCQMAKSIALPLKQVLGKAMLQ